MQTADMRRPRTLGRNRLGGRKSGDIAIRQSWAIADPLSYRSDPFGSLQRSDLSFIAKHSPERLTQ